MAEQNIEIDVINDPIIEISVSKEEPDITIEMTEAVPGPKGDEGLSVTGAEINNQGRLIVFLSDQTEIDAGLTKGAQGNKGDKGDTGLGLEFQWQGTQLGVRIEGQEEYIAVDLKGATGEAGPNQVSTSTDSSISGILKGKDGKVAQAQSGVDFETPGTAVGLVGILANLLTTAKDNIVNAINEIASNYQKKNTDGSVTVNQGTGISKWARSLTQYFAIETSTTSDELSHHAGTGSSKPFRISDYSDTGISLRTGKAGTQIKDRLFISSKNDATVGFIGINMISPAYLLDIFGGDVNIATGQVYRIGGIPIGKSDVGLTNVDNTSDVNKPVSTAQQTALNSKADLVGGLVPANQLPSFVDDVLSYANLAAFPVTGEDGKIYVAKDTNLTYRWTGTAYGVLDPSLAIGETSGTAYRGDRGKTAYDHSQSSGNPHNATTADISDSSDKRYVTDAQKTVIGNTSNTNSGDETPISLGSKINSATAKFTPANSDMIPIMDSEDSNVIKKSPWSGIKSALKTYFDTLYTTVASLANYLPLTGTSNSVDMGVHGVRSDGGYPYNPNGSNYTAPLYVRPGQSLIEGGYSLLEGTKVSTPDGEKNIEELKVGDVVNSYDLETNQPVTATITDNYQKTTPVYYLINDKIRCSFFHFFILSNGEKKSAFRLEIGDELKINNGTETIETKQIIREDRNIYGIELDNYHIYYADGYLVHNGGNEGEAVCIPIVYLGQDQQYMITDGGPVGVWYISDPNNGGEPKIVLGAPSPDGTVNSNGSLTLAVASIICPDGSGIKNISAPGIGPGLFGGSTDYNFPRGIMIGASSDVSENPAMANVQNVSSALRLKNSGLSDIIVTVTNGSDIITPTNAGDSFLSATPRLHINDSIKIINYTYNILAISEGQIQLDRIHEGYSSTSERVYVDRLMAQFINSAGIIKARLDRSGIYCGDKIELPHIIRKVASDTLQNHHDEERFSTSAGYFNIKGMQFPHGLNGSIRVRFDLKAATAGTTVTGQLINQSGVALGPEHTTTSSSYATFTDDIIRDWGLDEQLILKVKTASFGVNVYTRNLRVYYDDDPTVAVESINL
ncbi:MAG TPA: Hint domain-containing protein [Candidatus Cloacimonas sp.]|nr:Hint domain-containing protein [Candidatus Cloacimonas sp.]HPS60806.1 Hint domain-containing protein [Candidatus Cloacimonas sp.]